MAEVFFTSRITGDLYIYEMYFYYAEPQLFSVVDKLNHKYLVLLTDMDDHAWIMVPISETRLAELKRNVFPVRHAFISPEVQTVWRIKIGPDDNNSVGMMFPHELNSDDLPDEEFFVEWKHDEYLPSVKEDAGQFSEREGRDVIDISLLPDNSHRREIDCEALGKVLQSTQGLIYGFAEKKNKGRRKYAIKELYSTQVAGAYAASFGIRLISSVKSEMTGETPLSHILLQIARLLETRNNQKKIKAFLEPLGSDKSAAKDVILNRYYNLLDVLDTNNIGFVYSGTTPKRESFSVAYNVSDVRKSKSALLSASERVETVIDLKGILVAIDVDKKTFKLEQHSKKKKISGKLSKEIQDISYSVPCSVIARLNRTTDKNSITGKRTLEYELIGIKTDD